MEARENAAAADEAEIVMPEWDDRNEEYRLDGHRFGRIERMKGYEYNDYKSSYFAHITFDRRLTEHFEEKKDAKAYIERKFVELYGRNLAAADDAVLAEREECAQVADYYREQLVKTQDRESREIFDRQFAADWIGGAIRARSTAPGA